MDDQYDDTDEIVEHAGKLAARLKELVQRDDDSASSNLYARGLAIAHFLAWWVLEVQKRDPDGGSLKYLEFLEGEARKILTQDQSAH